jgi:ferrous iron transport protein A
MAGLKRLADLRPGEGGVIQDLCLDDVPPKLLEMGCLPGMRVTINYTAPLGDPMCLDVDGWQLAVRRDLAERIWVQTDQD